MRVDEAKSFLMGILLKQAKIEGMLIEDEEIRALQGPTESGEDGGLQDDFEKTHNGKETLEFSKTIGKYMAIAFKHEISGLSGSARKEFLLKFQKAYRVLNKDNIYLAFIMETHGGWGFLGWKERFIKTMFIFLGVGISLGIYLLFEKLFKLVVYSRFAIPVFVGLFLLALGFKYSVNKYGGQKVWMVIFGGISNMIKMVKVINPLKIFQKKRLEDLK